MTELTRLSEKKNADYLRSILVLLVVSITFWAATSVMIVLMFVHQNDAVDKINDCTVSTGACYKDANKRQGGAVKILNQFTEAVVQCADKLDGDQAIHDCALKKIEEGKTP